MWRRKKFIIIGVLAGVLLVGSIGGVALAQTENGDDSQNVTCREALLGEACKILINEWGCSEDITAADLGDVLERARQAVGNECQRPKRFGGPGELGACREAFTQAVCDYLNGLDGMDIEITPEQLEAAFADARSQMLDECQPPKRFGGQGEPGACREAFIQAVCDYLNGLDGMDIEITPEQLEAAFADARSQMPDECQPLGKGEGYRPGPGGHGGCRGMGGMRGFGGPFAPAE